MTIGTNIASGNHALVTNVGYKSACIGHIKFAFCVRLVRGGTVRGLHKQLCLAVLIQIIEHELVEVCTGGHFQTHIQSPKSSSVHLVNIEDSRRRRSYCLTGVKCVGRIPFYNNFILTIAVNVCSTCIINGIGSQCTVLSRLRFRSLKRNGDIILIGCCYCITCICQTVLYLFNYINIAGLTSCIHIVGLGGNRSIIYQITIAIDIESNILTILGNQ